MEAAMRKDEYLKKYLSVNDKKKRKKKIGTQSKSISRSKIIDDDIDVKAVAPKEDEDYDVEIGDEAPTVVAVVDERPEEVQKMEMFSQKTKWRVLGASDEDSESALTDEEADVGATGHWSKVGSGWKSINGHRSLKPTSKGRYQGSDCGSPRWRNDSSSEESPARDSHHKIFTNEASLSKSRHDSGSDQSPPRRKPRKDSDSDQSPARRKPRKDSGSDQSPARRKPRKDSDSDQSPPRRKPRKDSDSDHSPPRRKPRKDSGSDQSPPRRKPRKDSESDQLPPRRRPHQDSDSDHSPPRKSVRGTDGDRALQVDRISDFSSSTSHRHHQKDRSLERSSKNDVTRLSKTLDGRKAGLQDVATLRRENEAARQREERLLEKAGDATLGKNAETIVRSRATGRRRDFKAERRRKDEADAIKAQKEAKYKAWGKGLKQLDMHKSRLEADLHEVSKPLARYGDDADLDKMLREQEREGDPMLQFIKKNKKKRKDGTEKELPKYNGPAPPPNRYGIPPGYRWDGLDRSNGFEKSRFARHSDRLANLEQAYKWSVEDM